MKKFILKSSCFFLPFFLLVLLSNFFYTEEEGDLIRMGYIYRDPNYRKNFPQSEPQTKSYYKLSESVFLSKKKYDILVIGDSFSHQEKGFLYYLTKNHHLDCLLFNYKNYNPIQNLITTLNSDLLSNMDIDYIILESVERLIISHIDSLDFEKNLLIDTIDEQNKRESDNELDLNLKILRMLFYDILRPHASCKKKVYKFDLKKSLFSDCRDNVLLCYEDDVKNIEHNNNESSVRKLNQLFNELANACNKYGVKLIVLPAPDKYDAYFDFIKDNEMLESPNFFSILNMLPKDYIYIDSKSIFSTKLKEGMKDLYYFDDTHWSPIGAQLISNIIADSIKAKPHYSSSDNRSCSAILDSLSLP